MFTIRQYKKEDFKMIESWWDNKYPPTIEMLPESSTLILEIDKVPAYCLSVYLTNCKQYAYLGNFISNNKLKIENRKEASQVLMDSVCGFARELGYKNILCMTNVSKLKERYKEMGFTPTISDVQTFVKRI